MALEVNSVRKLRTVGDIVEANEWLFDQAQQGKVDAKALDGMNTVVKNQTYLISKLRQDFLKLWLTAKIKKIDIPQAMLPEWGAGIDTK
jgi:hypothetical protein